MLKMRRQLLRALLLTAALSHVLSAPLDSGEALDRQKGYRVGDGSGSNDGSLDNFDNYPQQLDRLKHDAPQYVYDPLVASTSPVLINKIRLACSDTGRANRALDVAAKEIMAQLYAYNLMKDVDKELAREEADVGLLPAKRDGSQDGHDIPISTAEHTGIPESLRVQKRIFGILSQLESFSNKEHDPQDRRHMHILSQPAFIRPILVTVMRWG